MKLKTEKNRKINEKNWFFAKMNKIDRLLARLTTKKGHKTQITTIRNETGDIITDAADIKNDNKGIQ